MVHLSELMLTVYFRKIHLVGMDRVPSDRPVLLAVNHPTAFTDPLFLGVFLDPPIYNMTRGDIFKKPFFRKLLFQINMFPVFRQRDGYADRDRNNEVFEYCFQKMQEKRVLTIYVEGEHHLDKRVKPMQKGIARIAFGAMQRHGLADLEIIPVGVNYRVGDEFRDEVMVNVGQPIRVQPFFENSKTAEGQAIVELLAEIWNGLEKNCFHIADPADDLLAEQLLTLHRSENPLPIFPTKIWDDVRFQKEKAVLDRLNSLEINEKTAVAERADAYFSKLKKAGLEDFAVMQTGWASFANAVVLLLTFPIFVLGWLTSRPIAWFVGWASAKVKKREFKSSVMLGSGQIFGQVYYFILLIFSGLKFGWLGLLGWLLFFLSGYFQVLWSDLWSNFWAARRAISFLKKTENQTLLELRRQIF